MTPLEWVLGALAAGTGREPRRSGEGYTSRCPGHDDSTPSLSIREAHDGRVLLYCHAGCPTDKIVHLLGGEMRDLMPALGGMATTPTARARLHTRGLTVEEYAAAKRVPVEFLAGLGVCTVKITGAHAVRIPYYSAGGEELAVQHRLALKGHARFRWRKGSKPVLYGQPQLARARELGYVVLVEGASDCHTLWLHEFPAVGIPGANTWREERDADLLEGIDAVYVVLEPDRGGDSVLAWLERSAIAPRARLLEVRAGDVSGLYLSDPERFRNGIESALQAATPWPERARFEAERRHRQAAADAAGLMDEPDLLTLFADHLEAAGLVGERSTCQLIYLAVTSRLLDRIVSIAVKGVSSGGKSYLVERVLGYFPGEAVYELTSMSEHALAYSTEPMAHGHLVVYEAAGLAGDFASYLMRSLLSENRIRYETVEKVNGQLQARMIERQGPTGLLVTTTKQRLHPENETRIVSLTINDTAEQTARVMLAIAEGENGTNDADLERWQALQVWLASGETRVAVAVPYAATLARLIPPLAVRLRRDFSTMLALIRAHALLHRSQRKRDDKGRIVATVDGDYAIVRAIVEPYISAGVEATVPDKERETVAAVAALKQQLGDEPVTIKQIAAALQLDRSAAYRRVQACITRAHLRNLEERKKSREARIVLGEPLPDDLDVLPPARRVHECTRGTGVRHPSPSEDITDLFARMVAILSERTANGQMTEADATAAWHQCEGLAPSELRVMVERLEKGS